ncbi:MAG TPA: amidase [Bryobacteraceae bacterium]|nr:amidase [Bryobacteraceae bacterium]
MAAIPTDVFFATVSELNARLVAREFSAEELARAFSARLERLGPQYNALALPLAQPARRQAIAVGKDIKIGRLRGPLQGIPYGVEDLLSVANQLTTWGAKPYADQRFGYDARVVEKLNSTGAVLTGKLSMVELAGGGGYRSTSASMFGPGLNPWDRARWSGGSSSGPAAAVAAGLVTFAIGMETSGSIITPASYCGVTALRPTYGLVSRYGAMPLSWTLDKLGPFARTAEDCGHILHAISGADGKDAGSAGKSFYYTPQYAHPLKDLKVGFAPTDFAGRADPAARPAFQAALAALRETGVQLVETKLPRFPYGPVLAAILRAEEASVFEPLIASAKLYDLADPAQIAGLRAALEIPARDYLKATRIRRQIQQAFAKLFAEVNLLVTYGRSGPAPMVDQPVGRIADAASAEGADPGFAGIIQAGNLAGLPALVLPCGFAGNLPVALQLVAAPFAENALLAAGKEFQARTEWHKRRPAGM